MKKLLLLLALIPAFFSCKHETNYIVTPNFTLENVVFTPADADSVRYEMNAFEGDEYGISLVDGSKYSPKNVRYRVYRDRVNLVCDDKPIKLDNDTMTVHAYGPYSESFDPEKSVENFTVRKDQSTTEGAKASNLVVAEVPGMDSDNPYIALRPVSKVTRIEVKFEGSSSNTIKECKILAKTRSTMTTISENDFIKMCKGTGVTGQYQIWYAYIPAQSFQKGMDLITFTDVNDLIGKITLTRGFDAKPATVKRFIKSMN